MVFGGSQGAASINSAIKRVIDQHKIPTGTQVFWQCGYLQYEKYKEWLVTSGKENVQLTAFIDDMWSAYQIADFCICRAGAMSIAELELATLPAILIPLKSAAGNHQFKNARVLEQRGCAKLIEDNGLLVHRLIEQINHLTEQPLEIKKMRENLAKSSKTDGGQLMVDEIYKILKEKNVWPE
jgi:UDP-N-acetylglucosamine--N-acetylmuramyl-(pentapeptide) pyrophosphoryl-undecaprenol N-acetylglucosamine transferase